MEEPNMKIPVEHSSSLANNSQENEQAQPVNQEYPYEVDLDSTADRR